MRIGIDGYNLAMPHGTGIASYGFTLAEAVRAMGLGVEGVFGLDIGADPALRETLFYDRLVHPAPGPATRRAARARTRRLWRAAANPLAMRAQEIASTDQVEKAAFAERLPPFDRLVNAPRLFEIARRHFELYGRFLRLRIDRPPAVMHWTYPVPVRLIGARNVYTLHDLVPLKLPYTTLDEKQKYHRLIAACVRSADQICTVSETSAADIRDRFAVPDGRITNTYQVSPLHRTEERSPDEDAATIRGLFGLEERGYLLYYGAIEPKKNVGRLVEAYLASGIPTPLVIVSSRAWGAVEELRLIAAAAANTIGGPGRVIRLEHLPRHLLSSLVRGARAVTFPSLYEGFGLPVLEALQLGVPVVTSTGGSLPEVAGDAAVFVDPYDIGSITAGLRRIDADAGLREGLACAGLVQAETFSAAAYRRRLELLYERALAPQGAGHD